METVSFGGRQVAGFALGATDAGGVSPTYAALMTGATAGLLAHALRAPLWGSVVAAAAVALVTKVGIDRTA